MNRILLLTAAAVISLASLTSDAQAQKHRGHGHKRNHVRHNIHVHYNHGRHRHVQINHHRVYRNFNNYKVKYVKFTKFPYRVCVYQNQYWVYYGNQWVTYHYLVKNHRDFWNWHHNYFHRCNHRYVQAKLYKFNNHKFHH